MNLPKIVLQLNHQRMTQGVCKKASTPTKKKKKIHDRKSNWDACIS